ncbi:MAG: ubiquitin-like domain-containing protein [Candidatus Woesebacteria bacterium]|jgi:uncharacterized protein YabE (DUF348 family)
MEQLFNTNRKIILWIAALVAPVLLALIWFFMPHTPLRASNERIITIYHDNQEQVVASDAKTVGEVLERANITLSEYDNVEPAKNTELVAANYSVNVYRARPVTVVDGNQRYRIMTAQTSAKEIAEAAGLTYYDEDTFTLERIEDFVAEQGVGLILTIHRSTPVRMILYGQAADVRTQAKTVDEFVKEKGIMLGENDGTSPSLDTPISDSMTIAVYRNGTQTINEEQDIAFDVERISDSDHEIGYKEVKESGTVGKKLVTYEVELRDGQEVSRKEIQSVVISEPKKQVEIVGTKSTFSGSFADALAQLRACEAGGNYANKNNPLYRGAYQYSYSTWANYGGYYDPADAPPEVQDQAAYETYLRRGWQPWPHCGASLPDTYR